MSRATDHPAGDQIAVRHEATKTTLRGSLRRLGAALALATFGNTTEPPVDVVLFERSDGRILRRWTESATGAAHLEEDLRSDLDDLTLAAFAEKWSCALPPD